MPEATAPDAAVEAAERPRSGVPRRRALLVVSLICLLLATALTGVLAWWYALDQGLLAVGGGYSQLLDPGPARLALALAAVAVPFAGAALVATWRWRRPVLATCLGGAALVAVVVAAAGAERYPQPTDAQVVGRAPGVSDPLWVTDTPARRLFGVRSLDDETVVVTGAIEHRGCRSEPVDLRIDLATGALLEVVELPDTYPSAEDVPPPPAAPDPERLELVPGEPTVTCAD